MIKSSPSVAKDKIVIGKVGAPHGIHGEVRILPLTDFPERFDTLEQVYVGDQLLDIQNIKYHKQFVIASFQKYPTREDVATLTGEMLYVDKKDAMPLSDGEYYTFDIIGLEVFNLEGETLGYVTEVLKTGSNDVYVCSQKGEAKQLLIPALKTVVKEIDLSANKMVVDLPEEA